MDVTDLRKTKSMLESVNYKLSMALDVSNIVPWRWDLERHTVLCDVNRPIELKHCLIMRILWRFLKNNIFQRYTKTTGSGKGGLFGFNSGNVVQDQGGIPGVG